MSKKRERCLKAVMDALREVKSVDLSNAHEGAHVIQQLGLESIDLVDLGFEVERILDVPFNLTEFFDSIRPPGGGFHVDFTLGQLVTFLEGKVE